jgi:hypothetical protein
VLSYEELCRHPAAFPSLTGMTRPEDDGDRFAPTATGSRLLGRLLAEPDHPRRA